MPATYDVFLSHAWADGDRPRQIKEVLEAAGLRVWFDAEEINDFASITRAVTEGLAQSKALVAYYSKTYPLRRACQWELTAAFLAAQIEGDQRRRVLVISPEEHADHIHPIELRDAKFRSAPRDRDNGDELQDLAQSIACHVASLEGPLASIHPLTPPMWYGTSPVGSTRFVGRLAEMWEVHSLLHAGDVTQITGAAVASGGIGQVSGMGGVGKSLLAEEYALQFGAAYPGGVFWLRAYGNDEANSPIGPQGRETERTGQIKTLAERLGIATRALSKAQIEGALARKIEGEGKPCLWIVDDVPNGLDGEELRRWIAPHPLAKTLITTRSREYGSLSHCIELSVLASEEAYELLTSRRVPEGAEEEEQVRLLTEDLGSHALALDVTASALQNSVVVKPFTDFRAKLAKPDKDALELAAALSDALPNRSGKSIAQTLLHSIRILGAQGLDFLRLASVLAVAPIPASLIAAVFEEADQLGHEEAEEQATLALKQVTAASLAETGDQNHKAASVHTLVSRTLRFHEKGSARRTETLRIAALEALRAAIADAAEDGRKHVKIGLHAAHARELVRFARTVGEADLLAWLARYDFERGNYSSARRLGEQLLNLFRQRLGSKHSRTMAAMNNLSLALFQAGEIADALVLQQKALESFRGALGREHPATVTSMCNLVVICSGMGDFKAARTLQEQVLAIRRRVSGSEHPDTLTAINNFAAILVELGEMAEARKLQEELLQVLSRVQGPEHPNTLSTMSNLGETMRNQGDLSEARKMQEKALAVRQRVFDADHPDILQSKNNLALVLSSLGDLAGARKMLEETVAIRRRLLGPESPETITSLNNLGATIQLQGELDEARTIQNETLELRRRILGPHHPEASISALNLTRTLAQLGEHAAGRNILQRDLLWLLEHDPASLGRDQREIRDILDEQVNKREANLERQDPDAS